MRRTVKALILAVLLAALPLRGYAGVLMTLCDAHHGGAAADQEHAYEHGDHHSHDSDDGAGSPSHAASVCSVCASCCANAGLASDAPHATAHRAQAADRIPFLSRGTSGFVPEHHDRPPLAL